MAKITIKPKIVTKRLLGVLSDRAKDVVVARFGLGSDSEKKTLEAIGQKYGITRERVRQIENYALVTIRKSDVYAKEEATFTELSKVIEGLGGIVSEEDFLDHLAKDASTQNHYHFLLVVGEMFTYERENADFAHRWHIDSRHARTVEDALKDLYQNLSDDDLIPESDFISHFLEHLQDVAEEYRNDEIARRWLGISKRVGRNALGEWGHAASPNVRAKRMRDYAFLVIRRHGSPMHFTEVAEAITKLFNRKAHQATCHNELIKDNRFVLVGRGLYALKEWGHASGVVRDVIAEVLRKHGPLTREEIIDKVLRERYVKENTIVVNLQNNDAFKRDKKGRYSLA